MRWLKEAQARGTKAIAHYAHSRTSSLRINGVLSYGVSLYRSLSVGQTSEEDPWLSRNQRANTSATGGVRSAVCVALINGHKQLTAGAATDAPWAAIAASTPQTVAFIRTSSASTKHSGQLVGKGCIKSALMLNINSNRLLSSTAAGGGSGAGPAGSSPSLHPGGGGEDGGDGGTTTNISAAGRQAPKPQLGEPSGAAAMQAGTQRQGAWGTGDSAKDLASNGARGSSRDIAAEARLLMSAVAGLRNKYGLIRSVQLLRGSRSKELQPWMLDAAHAVSGERLHGAGNGRTDSWWKALGGMLIAEGFLEHHLLRDFKVLRLTEKGAEWLQSGEALVRELSPALREEEEQEQRQQARACRKAMTRQQQQEAKAASAEARELRRAQLPGREEEGDEERQRQTESLRQQLRDSVDRLLARRAASMEGDGAGAGPAGSGPPLLPGGSEDGGGGGNATGVSEAGLQAARRLLGEPKGAAMEAGAQWQASASIANIATQRPRPIALSTAFGYVADCVAAGIVGDASRLALEAGVDRYKALAVAGAISAEAANGIGAVRRLLDSTGQPTDYGAIKVVAALMVSGSLWFAAPTPEGSASPAPPPPSGPSTVTFAAGPMQPATADGPERP